MSAYVGIDVCKHSQVAVASEDGGVQLDKNVVNGMEPFLRLGWAGPPHDSQAFWEGLREPSVASPAPGGWSTQGDRPRRWDRPAAGR